MMSVSGMLKNSWNVIGGKRPFDMNIIILRENENLLADEWSVRRFLFSINLPD